MKTIITLLLLSLFLHGNPHYMMEAVAYDNWAGTLFESTDSNVWAVDGDHYHGDVVLVMSINGTPDYIYDDRITAVIELDSKLAKARWLTWLIRSDTRASGKR